MARESAAIPGTFQSSIVVVNPNSVAATVNLNFVTSSGGAALSVPLQFTVPANSSVSKYVPSVPGLADGRYSVLVDSDQPVSAVASVQSDSPTTSASYNGISQAEVATTVYVPSIYKSYFGDTTSLVIQNAGSSSATATVTFRNASGKVADQTITIPASASVTLDQGDNTNLPNGFLGSAVVTSDQPVAVIFLKSNNGTALATGRGAKAGAPVVNLPAVMNRYYQEVSSVLVQNVDTAATTVEISYYDAKNGAKVGSQQSTIQPGNSYQFLQFDPSYKGDGSQGSAPVPFFFNGSAVVRSLDNHNIIAVANHLLSEQGYLESYNGFPTSAASSNVSCAEILNNYYNINSSVSIQNVGSAATDLTLTFRSGSNTVGTKTITGVPAGAVAFSYNPNDGLPDGFNGSLTISASGSGQIIATVSKLQGKGDVKGDVKQTYSCANS